MGESPQRLQPEKKRDLRWHLRWQLFAYFRFFVVVLLGVLVERGVEKFIHTVWPALNRFLHVWWLTLIGTVVISLIGFGLFLFRKYYQKFYGLAEIGFALAVGWTSIARAQTRGDAASWIAVLAAAYLIVRGLTNYEEGKRREVSKNKF